MSNDVIFQVTDFDTVDEFVDEGDDISSYKFVIRMFGITSDNKKVYVKATDFHPSFYVQLPKGFKHNEISNLLSVAKKKVEWYEENNNKEGLSNSLKDNKVVKKHIFKEFNDYALFDFLKLSFYNYEGFKAYERAFNWGIKLGYGKLVKYTLYQSNVEPLLKFIHAQNLKSCGFVKISKYDKLSPDDVQTYDDIAITAHYKNVTLHQEDSICPLVIAAFDIECYSCDGKFPRPSRDSDKIIQIGTTFSKHGESECFLRHIITLGTCDPIDGATVKSCKTEKEVLMAWQKLITKVNPDIITGYNIFGFDYQYMEARATKLGCQKEFSQLGRMKGEESKFVVKDLSSAALGKNKLQYYVMKGRVNIDIMKDVQKNHKLTSYKLDNVAAEFIRDKVVKVDVGKCETTIYTKTSTYGLEVGDISKCVIMMDCQIMCLKMMQNLKCCQLNVINIL